MDRTREDILCLLNSSVDSAALGVAIELGLFWLLDKESRTANEIAQELGMPRNRCHLWLEHLRNVGFLDKTEDCYVSSSFALETVIETYTRNSWSLLEQEAR
ncbi:MAG: methyltransferase family protein [Candidatus Thorarchaeota archaeon]|jgi:DNA-binding IclR family transcriptional regulator